MAIDLHTRVDTSLPERKHGEEDVNVTVTLPRSCDSTSILKPYVLIPREFGSNGMTSSTLPRYTEEQEQEQEQGIVINKDEDFVAELTRHMSQFMLQQDDEKFDFSGIGSKNSESSRDSSMGSPQSTVWSHLGSSLGSPEGSPHGNIREYCRETTTYDAVRMFEKMRIYERSENSKHHHNGYYGTHNQSLKNSNVGTCSRQSLIHDQIRAIQLSRLKQEQILCLKQKLAAYRELEYKEEIMEFEKKSVGLGIVDDNSNINRYKNRVAARQGHLLHHHHHNQQQKQQPCSEMQAIFLGGSDSRGASCGTGVFLPRGRITASSQSRNRSGKGCSNILIPARVVQALQIHFDQMAATSGPKPGGFPPLHDVLVSNRDGMYSLQKRQSRKPPANMQNDMILPREWTY